MTTTITTPNQMGSGTSKLNEALQKFEAEFAKNEKDEDFYHLVIVGEYNRDVCDEIQNLYTNAGWKNVVCKTSSENGERGGLTGLRLSRI